MDNGLTNTEDVYASGKGYFQGLLSVRDAGDTTISIVRGELKANIFRNIFMKSYHMTMKIRNIRGAWRGASGSRDAAGVEQDVTRSSGSCCKNLDKE